MVINTIATIDRTAIKVEIIINFMMKFSFLRDTTHEDFGLVICFMSLQG
jgi:hypothetical protein